MKGALKLMAFALLIAQAGEREGQVEMKLRVAWLKLEGSAIGLGCRPQVPGSKQLVGLLGEAASVRLCPGVD